MFKLRICSDNCTCCHTEIEVVGQTCYLILTPTRPVLVLILEPRLSPEKTPQGERMIEPQSSTIYLKKTYCLLFLLLRLVLKDLHYIHVTHINDTKNPPQSKNKNKLKTSLEHDLDLYKIQEITEKIKIRHLEMIPPPPPKKKKKKKS